jgi:hypothetical protein
MQHGVGVMENVALGNLAVVVVLPELFQAPISEIVLLVALLVVAKEWDAGCPGGGSDKMQIGKAASDISEKWFL